MRKHRLSISLAGSAVAAGTALGTAIATGQPASATVAGPKPANAVAQQGVLAALPTTASATTFGRSLALGSLMEQGGDVKALQTAYAFHGFHLAIDGVFGPQTEGV